MRVTARPAVEADHAFYAQLVPLLASGDEPLPFPAWNRSVRPESFIYQRDGERLAYAWAQPLTPVAYVKNVMVVATAQGQGVGREVMDHLATVLRGAGATEWVLNVKPDNEPAVRLYRSVGMKVEYASTALRLKWPVVDQLPVANEPASGGELPAGDDQAVERAFGLTPGQLTAARADGRYKLLRLEGQGGALLGVARFDPSFPGAFPFRVRKPELARALLEAMRAHALPSFDFTGVVVEDDAPLTTLLRSAGAETRLEMFHMRGKL
jgi:GNAT superfamily N-acetyltransferase